MLLKAMLRGRSCAALSAFFGLAISCAKVPTNDPSADRTAKVGSGSDVAAGKAINGSYLHRDGEAEAHADVAADKPIKIYFRQFNGFVAGWETPGIVSCQPNGNGPHVFNRLIGADWAEGETYSADEHARQASATRFAIAYNQAAFRLRPEQVRAVCPTASLHQLPL